VARDEETRRFRLGSGAIELGRLARAAMGLRSVSLPILERLAAETGETAVLTALNRDRNRSVCLDRVESMNDLRLSVEPGRQNLLHAGASQKALLSFMREEEIEAVIAAGLPRLCRATITDPAELRDSLEEIRKRGWATSYEETNLGAWGIALTLLDNKGSVVAAVGLAGPRVRMPRAKVAIVLEVLRNGAADIAGTLGLKTSIQLAEESRRTGTGEKKTRVNARGANGND
jgi:DNA-binding IclR family transcriptional regulator